VCQVDSDIENKPVRIKVAIIAGEASGDILGAGLISAMKERHPNIEFFGIGGELMIEQGCISKVPMEQLSVMGLFEVLSRLRMLLKLRKQLIAEFLANPPDLFIGIDAPDFNLNIEKALKQAGVLTVHYVSPSVWAWKRKRIYIIKQAVDLLLCLFPFEAQHYTKTKQKLAYVGHPLAQDVSPVTNIEVNKLALGFVEQDQLIAVLPGSRSSEIKYLLPVFLQTIQALHDKYPAMKFVIPAANQYRYQEIKSTLADYTNLPITLVLKQSREVMAAADVILIASGTATLEATLLAKPMVVAYKMATLTYAIYSRMIKTPFVSLPNILANEMLVPELLQGNATPEKLSAAVENALTNKTHRSYQMQKFSQIHQLLNLNASEKATQAITELLEDRQKL
jgi:lipid-A-disaccharide synthase